MGPDTEYALINLSRDKFAVIDLLDFGEISRHRWTACPPAYNSKTWRASAALPRSNGKQFRILMHRLLMGVADPKVEVDHKNRDGLDNRRRNLRFASRSEQQCNVGITARNKTGVKGVYVHSPGWFRSYVAKNGKRFDLGTFRTIEDASSAYQETAKRLHGEFFASEVSHS